MIKRYNDKKNVSGSLIKKIREEKNIGTMDLCRKLELHGIYIDRTELYLLEHNQIMIKDFELLAIAKVLNVDLNEFKNLID